MRTTIAHNLIQGGGPAAVIDGPFPDPIWRDNKLWQTRGGRRLDAPGGVHRGHSHRSRRENRSRAEDLLKQIRRR